MNSEKEMFMQLYEREHLTTVKVMKNFPEEKLDFKPSEKSMSAKQLLWLLATEEKMLLGGAIKGKMDFSGMGEAPHTVNEIIAALETNHKDNILALKNLSDANLAETIDFFVGPKTPGKVPKMTIAWMMVHDQIHHRGQLSVYLRLVGAKVPSIYGPSADEPWM